MKKEDLKNYLLYNNFGLVKTASILNCYDKIKDDFPAYKNKLEMIYNYPVAKYDSAEEELENSKIIALVTKWDCDYNFTDAEFDFYLNSNYTIEQKEAIITVIEKLDLITLEELAGMLTGRRHDLSAEEIIFTGAQYIAIKKWQDFKVIIGGRK